MNLPRVENFEAYQNDKFALVLHFDMVNNPIRLGEYSFYGQVRTEYGSENVYNFETVIFVNPDDVDSSGEPLEDARVNKISMELLPETMVQMEPMRYVYDIFMVKDDDSNEDRQILMSGILDVLATSTRF